MSRFAQRLQRTYKLDDFVPPQSSIVHGADLTLNDVGPWALQGVAKGNEVLGTSLSIPPGGYWRFDTPDAFLPTAPWPANANDANPAILNNPNLRGGVVTGSSVTIDGYDIPVGTRIVQFQQFPETDFYARTNTLKVFFRGCRFRFEMGVSGSGLFNDSTAGLGQSIWMHYCDVGLTSIDPPGGEGLMHVKFLGGANHRILRGYHTKSSTFLQPNNVGGWKILETWIDEPFFAYGEIGSNTTHMNGISSEGGVSNGEIARCHILMRSPDGSTGSSGSAEGHIGYGTQPGQPGYGSGTNPGRLIIQTDCIAMFGTNSGVVIDDNLLGGAGYCLYSGGASGASSNIKVRRNKFSTQFWTNGGNFGAVNDQATWGSNGNEKADNIWTDDYGLGGNGCTALADRQYPSGNGPRVGIAVF